MKSNLAHFEERYRHAWNKIEWHVPADLKRGRFLDIGCGIGNGVAAAAAHGASLSLGIDRSLSEFGDAFFETEFPELCAAVGADPKHTLLMEADLFATRFPTSTFDYAMMLDSAEHVPDPRRFFEYAFEALRPGGCFMVDTCPLFYSPVGAHLWGYFPPESEPWAHLRPNFLARCAERGVSEWSMSRFKELNRATHDDLRSAFTASGFAVVQEHRSQPTPETLALFERHGATLDLTGVQQQWLFEDWILLVGRK